MLKKEWMNQANNRKTNRKSNKQKRMVIGFGMAAMILAVSLTGCQSNTEKKDSTKKDELKTESSSESGEKQDEEQGEYVVYLGRVKSIVGNEIELEIAKDTQIEEKEEGTKEDKEEMPAAVISQPAMSKEDASDENIPGETKEAKLELEYTGEIQNIQVPAGATINVSTGNDGKVTDIKDGDIIQAIGFSNGDQLSIDNITILN